MPNIVELARDQMPPKGADWAMVLVNAVGATMGQATIRHSMGVTFYANPLDVEIDRAISKAMAWAKAHAVKSVYVRR